MEQSNHLNDRKFLHDLATPLMVAKTMVKKVITELSGEGVMDNAALVLRLQKAVDALQKIEDLHADRKSDLSLREVA